MPETPNDTPPEATLLIGPGCPYCARVLESLGELVKEAALGRLDVINVAAKPEAASSRGVRSVPWLRLGPFELEGVYSPKELREWVERSHRPDGMSIYFKELLTTGGRARVEARIRREPEVLELLVALLTDLETSIDARLGIMATFEEMEGEEPLHGVVHELGRLTRSEHSRIRDDACHALSFTRSREAMTYLRDCLEDPDEDVRTTAAEAIEAIDASIGI